MSKASTHEQVVLIRNIIQQSSLKITEAVLEDQAPTILNALFHALNDVSYVEYNDYNEYNEDIHRTRGALGDPTVQLPNLRNLNGDDLHAPKGKITVADNMSMTAFISDLDSNNIHIEELAEDERCEICKKCETCSPFVKNLKNGKNVYDLERRHTSPINHSYDDQTTFDDSLPCPPPRSESEQQYTTHLKNKKLNNPKRAQTYSAPAKNKILHKGHVIAPYQRMSNARQGKGSSTQTRPEENGRGGKGVIKYQTTSSRQIKKGGNYSVMGKNQMRNGTALQQPQGGTRLQQVVNPHSPHRAMRGISGDAQSSPSFSHSSSHSEIDSSFSLSAGGGHQYNRSPSNSSTSSGASSGFSGGGRSDGRGDGRERGTGGITYVPRGEPIIEHLPYFYEMNREKARDLLVSHGFGCFLIRPCSDPKHFVRGAPSRDVFSLTYCGSTEEGSLTTVSVKIFRTDKGYTDEQERFFKDTITKFIEHGVPQAKKALYKSRSFKDSSLGL